MKSKYVHKSPEELILFYNTYQEMFGDGLELTLLKRLNLILQSKNIMLSQDRNELILKEIEGILESYDNFQDINKKDLKKAFKIIENEKKQLIKLREKKNGKSRSKSKKILNRKKN